MHLGKISSHTNKILMKPPIKGIVRAVEEQNVEKFRTLGNFWTSIRTYFEELGTKQGNTILAKSYTERICPIHRKRKVGNL